MGEAKHAKARRTTEHALLPLIGGGTLRDANGIFHTGFEQHLTTKDRPVGWRVVAISELMARNFKLPPDATRLVVDPKLDLMPPRKTPGRWAFDGLGPRQREAAVMIGVMAGIMGTFGRYPFGARALGRF